MRHFIGRRRHAVPASFTVQGTVDPILRVLDPDSHGKCLRGHPDLHLLQHAEGTAGGMSDRQHHSGCLQVKLRLFRSSLLADKFPRSLLGLGEFRHSGSEINTPAPFDDLICDG